MPSNHKNLYEFLESVCMEIKYKGAHKDISKELADHIEDQKAAYMEIGLEEDAAVIRAIEEMGDPAVIGRQLNETHKPKTEWSILAIMGILVSISAWLQYFMSGIATGEDRLLRFITYVLIGILVFLAIYFFDYSLLRRYAKMVYAVIFGITILGFSVLPMVKGTYFHLYYATLLFIPVFGGIVYSMKDKNIYGIFVAGAFYIPVALLFIWTSAFTPLLFFSTACLSIMLIAIAKGFFKCSKKQAFAAIIVPVLSISALYAKYMPAYARDRIIHMFNPELDPRGSGYMLLTIRKLVASSHALGTAALTDSAGMSINQTLPNWSTDFLLTYITARFGYIPAAIMVALMIFLVVRMFILVFKQQNPYGFLISLSVCITIAGQILFYILSNFGILIPVSFILPLISYGAYGFIINMGLLGLLLSVHRRMNLIPSSSK